MKSLDIKLVQIETITDMSFMLYNCESLLTLPDISNLNTSCITDMSYMFFNCTSLLIFPDISKWDVSNVRYMNFCFMVINHYHFYLKYQNGIFHHYEV